MGYIGRGPVKSGAFRIIDSIASSFNGSTTGFTLQHNSSNITPGTEQNLLIAVDGVMQEPVDAFTISGSTITFTSAPASGASFWGVELGDVGGIASSVSNNAINSEHYVDGSIDNEHLATGIDAVKLADGSVTNAELQYINSLSSNAQDQITVVENDIKQLTVTANYLALRVTALASLGDYNLGNIMIDDFQDTTGIDASNSTNEVHNNTNKYYAGTVAGSGVDSYVKLLMHFDNNLTDSSDSNHTVTDTGNASFAFEGTTKKFGSHSGNFGAGTQRKLTVAASSDWLMGTDPWTVDFWLYYQNSGEIFGDYNTFRIFIESNKIKFKGGGINTYLANTELTQNTWLHIAVQRGAAGNGANIRAWVNGTHYGYQTANTTSMGSSSTAPIIGHGDAWLGVYMDELRVSKGIARYPDNTNSITVPTSAYTSPSHQNMTLLSNATTATDVPTKGDLLITYEDSSGTATLNTDLKGYISRNNGSTYTQGTLVAEGTIGTQKVAAFHDVDISGQSSGSAIKYKIEALNQSATKGTNIHGVAMGWS